MFLQWLSRRLAAYLTKSVTTASVRTCTYEALEKNLQPGDVLLVEGNARISVAIKFITQSTWSHAALYLGPGCGLGDSADGEPNVLIEADLEEGIRRLPLSFYRNTHTRICRPVGLDEKDLALLRAYALRRLGDQYDLKNVFDLARYLWSTPPIPTKHRHKLLTFGSGDPTKTICSTFIAEGFQLLHYPILPIIKTLPSNNPDCEGCTTERFRFRPYRLFTPRDFDASPYFRIIKPTIEENFDYRTIPWLQDE
ncbi:MAG TPA: YiiX/YebB-like N1pC/P60 family cysteine hydrolase [Marinobacter sp.]|nr:YiiX/YebB-like N1pC/P60 family cysteine hydrolase [Marinobacter sp.]